jgi:hypothetical protein
MRLTKLITVVQAQTLSKCFKGSERSRRSRSSCCACCSSPMSPSSLPSATTPLRRLSSSTADIHPSRRGELLPPAPVSFAALKPLPGAARCLLLAGKRLVSSEQPSLSGHVEASPCASKPLSKRPLASCNPLSSCKPLLKRPLAAPGDAKGREQQPTLSARHQVVGFRV